jgi:hypothetical protein
MLDRFIIHNSAFIIPQKMPPRQQNKHLPRGLESSGILPHVRAAVSSDRAPDCQMKR